jgi:homoserine dehydrogenase
VLAQTAFGRSLTDIRIEPLTAKALERMAEARHEGKVVRLVAAVRKAERKLVASVALEALPAEHALAQTRQEWNTLLVQTQDRAIRRITGRGAGRWPTTEAVIADLFEIRRAQIVAYHAGQYTVSIPAVV